MVSQSERVPRSSCVSSRNVRPAQMSRSEHASISSQRMKPGLTAQTAPSSVSSGVTPVNVSAPCVRSCITRTFQNVP